MYHVSGYDGAVHDLAIIVTHNDMDSLDVYLISINCKHLLCTTVFIFHDLWFKLSLTVYMTCE